MFHPTAAASTIADISATDGSAVSKEAWEGKRVHMFRKCLQPNDTYGKLSLCHTICILINKIDNYGNHSDVEKSPMMMSGCGGLTPLAMLSINLQIDQI